MAGRQPTHHVLAVIEAGEGRTFYRKVGAGWETKDGRGVMCTLDFVPRDPATKLLITPPKEDER